LRLYKRIGFSELSEQLTIAEIQMGGSN